jgi:dTDP-4-dehydrorhamnose 3,5-epimerase
MTAFEQTSLPGVILCRPRLFSDPRGRFHESWNRPRYVQAGIDADFMQDNLAVSTKAGTLRGLHYQRSPMAQAKLVWVIKGAILDVVVDMRPNSASFGRHLALRLSAEGGEQLFVPKGFAHGYCTLEDDCIVAYKVDAPWSPEHEGGIRWNDPALAIDWPVTAEAAIMAERDRQLPLLAEAMALPSA